MSVSYTSILWNKQKKIYDKGIAIFVLTFLILFTLSHSLIHPDSTFETTIIRGFGLLSLLLLHIILIIGPLARINTKYLIILYNRRHLGVTMFFMALIHGGFSIMQFHSRSNMNPIRSLFLSNTHYDSLIYFPFELFGVFALAILALMAATSHDFWLKNLGPKLWKALHMMVYIAYASILLHVVLGGIQNESSPVIFTMVMLGFVMVVSLHIYSALKEVKTDMAMNDGTEWIKACSIHELRNNCAKIVTVSGERVAIFKYDDQISAINNVCGHQGGPLGEGKIIDGCITCPWHGYQYLPHNGQSPPPFTEKVETYNLQLKGEEIWIDPKPNPEGTEVAPVKIIPN